MGGTPHTVVHRYPTYDNTTRWSDNINDPILRSIAARIILQAMEDWIDLIRLEELEKAKADAKRIADRRIGTCGSSDYAEIRRFFQGQYGEMLCEIVDLRPTTVLDRLESWLETYREDGTIPKHTFRISD